MEKTFQIPYKTLIRSELSDIERELEQRAVSAATRAYAPYSHFLVGAAVLLANGEIAGRVPFISPCGSCRQVIMETATRFHPFPILLCGEEEIVVLEDCRTLLPFGFDSKALL